MILFLKSFFYYKLPQIFFWEQCKHGIANLKKKHIIFNTENFLKNHCVLSTGWRENIGKR